MTNYIFGEIDGVKEGDIFRNRAHLIEVGIHKVRQAGIDGNPKDGCSSIVLNGGYVDDQDLGEEIIYTGHGGNDPNTNKQISDQSWDARGNKALIVSEMHGIPVRVTRGHNHKSTFSPKSGYQYGGLYLVTEHFEEIGKDGFKICRYRLEKITKEIIETTNQKGLSKGNKITQRTEVTISRIIRDTKVSREIKELYNYECQVCGIVIEVNGVRYAEAAHIKPLGKPHNGEDTPENLICLCPNHHIMFDKGVFSINKDLKISGVEFEELNSKHSLNLSNLRYHNKHIHIK